MLQKVLKYYRIVIAEWKSALSNAPFRNRLLIMPGLFFIYAAVTQKLALQIEARKGAILTDPILNLLPSINFSFWIFILLYSCLVLVVVTHLHKPKIIYQIAHMHFWVAVVRQITIILIALEPPPGIIVLRDVFLENTVYPHLTPLTKDLFFSGHVASIWIYFLCTRNVVQKKLFVFATIAMGFMVMSMRVHYSYDVYGAIFITTIIYHFLAKRKIYAIAENKL